MDRAEAWVNEQQQQQQQQQSKQQPKQQQKKRQQEQPEQKITEEGRSQSDNREGVLQEDISTWSVKWDGIGEIALKKQVIHMWWLATTSGL